MELNERDTRLMEKCDWCAGQGSVSGGKRQCVVGETIGKPGDDGGVSGGAGDKRRGGKRGKLGRVMGGRGEGR